MSPDRGVACQRPGWGVRLPGCTASGCRSNLCSMDWGTLPDWVAAISTGGAFAVTLFLLGREMKARKQAEKDRLESEARKVAAWVDWHVHELAINLKNAAETPVYDCIVYLGPSRSRSVPGLETWDFHFPVVAPGETQSRFMCADDLAWEPPDHEPDEHGF
jgi:hypothetical protein